MWKPPIDIFYKTPEYDLSQNLEETIVKAVLQVGIDVDKAELLKALEYDRGQYDKGFADGFEEGRLAMIKEVKSIVDERFEKVRP